MRSTPSLPNTRPLCDTETPRAAVWFFGECGGHRVRRLAPGLAMLACSRETLWMLEWVGGLAGRPVGGWVGGSRFHGGGKVEEEYRRREIALRARAVTDTTACLFRSKPPFSSQFVRKRRMTSALGDRLAFC